MKTVIGITGKIGAGKSSIIQTINHPMVQVFDCDAVIHRLYHDREIMHELQTQLGKSDCGAIRHLLTKPNASTILKTLNNIFSPHILKAYHVWIKGKVGLILIDVPLLFESNWQVLCDITIQISTDGNIRKNRVKHRDTITGSIFDPIDGNQMVDYIRSKYADFTLTNNDDLATAATQFKAIIEPYIPKIAFFPGSFDPITNGHLDIIAKAANIFDRVVVGIGYNEAKNCVLSLEERLNLIKHELGKMSGNIIPATYNGLLIHAAKDHHANWIIRGIRDSADAINELNMSSIHSKISSLQTVFIPTDPKYAQVSSSAAKVLMGSKIPVDLSDFVSDNTILKFKLLDT